VQEAHGRGDGSDAADAARERGDGAQRAAPAPPLPLPRPPLPGRPPAPGTSLLLRPDSSRVARSIRQFGSDRDYKCGANTFGCSCDCILCLALHS
jgi:hypothetical protein